MVVLSDYRNIYNKLDGLLVLMILMENSLMSHYHLEKNVENIYYYAVNLFSIEQIKTIWY
jgi:hypothetical protein